MECFHVVNDCKDEMAEVPETKIIQNHYEISRGISTSTFEMTTCKALLERPISLLSYLAESPLLPSLHSASVDLYEKISLASARPIP